MSTLPPPPPGFVMQGAAVPPPPPPGFVLQGAENAPPAIPERKPEPPEEPGIGQRARELVSGVNFRAIAPGIGMLPDAVGGALGYAAEKLGAPETAASLRNPVMGSEWLKRRFGDVGIEETKPTDTLGEILANVGGMAGSALLFAPLTGAAAGGKALLSTPGALGRFAATEAGGAVGAGLGQTAGKALDKEMGGSFPLAELLLSGGGGMAGSSLANLATRPRAVPAADVAARQSAADKLGVKLTTGQATRNPQAQLLEQEALRGGAGAPAQNMMRQAMDRQQQSLTGALDDIAETVTGARALPEPGAAAATVQKTLVDKADDAKRAIDAAYDSARGMKGGVKAEALRGNDLRSSVADFSLETAPRARALLDEFDGMVKSAGGDFSIPFREIETFRRKLVNARSTTDPTDAAALRKVTTAFDDMLKSRVSKDMIEGDLRAIDAYAKARDLRASFGRVFEQGDVVEQLIERTGQARQLATTPDKAANVLLGGERLGLVKMENLSALKKALPAESWKEVRTEAFTRLFGKAIKTDETTGARTFASNEYRKALDAVKERNPHAYRMLFSAEERSALNDLGRVAGYLKIEPGGVNSPNTARASELLGKLGSLFGNIPFAGDAVRGGVRMLTDAGNERRLAKAASGAVLMARSAVGRAGMAGTRFGAAALAED